MHTETTLFHFSNCTTRLGQALRKFSCECGAKFQTYNLPRETAARARCKGAKSAKMGTAAGGTIGGGPKPHTFNMSTYKLHTLGDYVKSIWQFGRTDNYSTQVVSESLLIVSYCLPNHNLDQGELEHCRVKRFYSWTNKIGFTRAIAKHQQCERLLHRIQEENHAIAMTAEGSLPTAGGECPSLHFVNQEPLPNCAPDAHYQVSQGKKYYWDLVAWLSRNKDDKALEVCPFSLEELEFTLL